MRESTGLLLVGSILATCVAVQSQISQADAPAVMERQVKNYQAWTPKLNSPGVSIELRETERSSPRIKYLLYAKGFPPGHRYAVISQPANQLQPQTMITGVTLDASGLAICAGTPGTCSGNGPNDPISLVFTPVKSEPIRIALVSDDEQHIKALTRVIPIPNRTTDKNCALESVMLAPKAVLVALEGSGFKPNADVTFLSESEGEHHDGVQRADADGNLFIALGQGVKGKDGGTTKVSVVSADCSLSLNLRWGRTATNISK